MCSPPRFGERVKQVREQAESDVAAEAAGQLAKEGMHADAVAEAPWSVAEWVVAPRFDNPRGTVLVLVFG